MNILKKINLKQKLALTKSYVKEYLLVKKSIVAVGVAMVLSLLIIQITVPKFYVSAVLREAKPLETQGISIGGAPDGLFSDILGVAGSDGNYEEMISNMRSYIVAQRLWDKGWGSIVFGNGQIDEDYFNNIPKNHKLLDRLGSWILGYQLYEYYSAHDLKAFISDSVFPRKDIRDTNITVSMLSSDKEFAIKFIEAVILETDSYAKEYLIAKSNEIISASYKQLAVSKNSSISSALASTINSEYFKIATLNNDMPYKVYFIDPPHSSEYPVTPNIYAIFISAIIISLFLSSLHSFILKNKDEIW